MNFEFQDELSPIEMTHRKSHQLQYVNPADIIHASYDWSIYDEALLKKALSELSTDNFFILFAQSDLPITYSSMEPYYGTEFSLEKLNEVFLNELAWSHDSENIFKLPVENHFIAENFSIFGLKAQTPGKPEILCSDPEFRVWFKQDDTFLLPKASIFVIIKNPFVASSPYNYGRSILWKDLLADHLNENMYPAFIAGLSFKFSLNVEELIVEVSGYNDKLSAFLQTIITEMLSFVVKADRFSVLHENIVRKLSNFEHDPPYQHAAVFSEYCLSNLAYSSLDFLVAIKGT